MCRVPRGVYARVAFGFAIFSIIFGTLITRAAFAGGFYAPYQSGQAIGSALAGASARSDDSSFFFFNPATIAGLERANVTMEGRIFVPSVRIEAERATSPLGMDITGAGNSGDLAGIVGAPGGFAAIPLAKNIWLGIGASGHFAVDIDADPGWAGRFQLLKTDIVGWNFSSALVVRVTDWLALAGGVQIQHLTGEFEKSELIPTFFGPLESRGFLEGDDWATGGIAGILLTPTDSTRIGIGYRSQLSHRLKGTAGAVLPGIPIPVDSAEFDVDLPDIVSVGLEQRISPTLRIFLEGQWVGWSRFKGFDIAFGSGRPNELRAQDWDDTWMGAIGFGYMIQPGTEITAGVHYDTAVTDGGGNTLSPDGNRTMVALGLNHKVMDRGVLSLYYAHVFFEDAPIEVTQPRSGSFEGTFEADLDIIGLSLRMDW